MKYLKKEMEYGIVQEFWNWMLGENYAYGYMTEDLYDAYGVFCKPTKQMLIGYMLEYIDEKSIILPDTKFVSIEEYYNFLATEINSYIFTLNKEKE